MINLQITNYEAIALQDLLSSLNLLCSASLPASVKDELLMAYATNPKLQSIDDKLMAELDNLVQAQRTVLRGHGGGDRTP